jgi:type IV pilus assembly protein PilA
MASMFGEYGAPPIGRRWIWTLRLATIVLLLVLLFPTLYPLLTGERPFFYSSLLLVIVYGGLLWALRENPPGKATLATAVSMSVFPLAALFVSIAFALHDVKREFSRLTFQWGAPWTQLALLQVVLLASALAAVLALRRKKRAAGATWTMRLAAAASIVLMLSPIWSNAWATWEFGYLGYLWSLLWQLAGALLNGVVLWSLRRQFAELDREARGALLLAAGTGAYLLFYSLGKSLENVFASTGSRGEAQGSALPAYLFMGGFFVAHGVLGGAAIRVYYKLGRQTGDVSTLVKALFLSGLGWVVFGFMLGDELRHEHWRGHGNEASAVGSLRTINTSEVTYASTYSKGFSPRLAALGPVAPGSQPSATSAGLIDSVLASGQKSGYNFIYTPGPRDAEGRILSYTVIAQPATPGVSGQRSFFTDQTGVVRATGENRPAAVSDPPT